MRKKNYMLLHVALLLQVEELYIIAQADVVRLNSDDWNTDKVPVSCCRVIKNSYITVLEK